MGWAQEEFKTLQWGDERLNARAVLLTERLAAKPTGSIPNACSGWAETQAAYRFLGRKGDGEPGAKTLWLGLRDVAVFVQGLRFARLAL